jgi:2-polyprenyl-3-methyl-5-hydroxy-6-metoxy-1,4-benzoquinol methylase
MKVLDERGIRPKKLDVERERLYKEDLKKFNKKTLVKINCPACNSSKFKLWTKKMGFNFVLCQKCKTLFVNPRPNELDLEKFFTSSKTMKHWNKIFRETETIRKEKIFKPRIKMIKKILREYDFSNCKTMIEVGAGYGWFCELSKKMKLAEKIIAIEPSHMQAESCRRIKGIEVIESTFEKYQKEVNSDIIVNFEVLHSIPCPRKFLKLCHKQLRNGGIFICTTPNCEGLDIQILKNDHDNVVPHFLTIFNTKSIEFLLKSVGFKKIKISTPGLLDIQTVINKIKFKKKDLSEYPFFEFLINSNNNELKNDIQKVISKYKNSSHMLIVAQK